MTIFEIEKTITRLRKTQPLILCLSNTVTQDIMANGLLALGAAPLMTQDPRELEELVQLSAAININIGTLDPSFIATAQQIVNRAKQYQKAIVLDPVGAGASRLRTETAQMLLPTSALVRGNASEILALSGAAQNTRGVETVHKVQDASDGATQIAKQQRCTVVVSGPLDFITDGIHHKTLPFGSPLMARVTGMGCTLSAVIAAFVAVVPDVFTAASMATAYFGLCGTLAAAKTHEHGRGPASFKVDFIDELYNADLEKMRPYLESCAK